ncbi:hypothetical protein [Pseudomonas amygdali]|uniref:hypothetical protein n=1 Tax=Pseudomonas amygdali TaxID=47877 RepID=UPI0001CC2449|nr:hypothetical protein [Pseudomonas amygdali]KWT10748.1 hypothetical protein AL041_18325 [Pseudomonas amygdali pv. aesculi]KWT21695.1 hypothetical protein AL043_25300 [Pseudomonas amygdali pv. aesculi]KWT25792.1 hypothetical protein AL042_16695 [Pseudomonas amygdali pv. aesculi]KWT28700.1 hypothetical protein AL044_15765 [Pseudomonas amygdali pv. aesculi]KWT35565.1 hypothetical protein AL045_25760 [Pseudomonas amygdali pv. aesculi]
MAKHLTARDIELLVGLIDGWNGKLTWDAVCDEAKGLIGTRPTRQTLNAHARIKSAFGDKKVQQKVGFKPKKRPESLAIAEQRIHRLDSENHRLKAENNRLIERFVRWQYNAQIRGISQAVLDAPLPEIDRDSAEK